MAESSIESSGVYQIIHRESGRSYIGSAVLFRVRWNQHRNLLRKEKHHSPFLQNAWNKHGSEAFDFVILEVCAREECIAKEQAQMDRIKPEFNVCSVAGSCIGRKHGPATLEKLREKATGRKHLPRSQEHRDRLGAAHKGKAKAPEHMAALQQGRSNQVFTEERRASVGASLKLAYANGLRKREKTEPHKQKIGKAFAKLSDDQVRSIREMRATGMTFAAIGLQFGSPSSTILQICSGKRYRWVT